MLTEEEMAEILQKCYALKVEIDTMQLELRGISSEMSAMEERCRLFPGTSAEPQAQINIRDALIHSGERWEKVKQIKLRIKRELPQRIEELNKLTTELDCSGELPILGGLHVR